ncbi:hypothetical protein L226DRAFT_538985 [Lentinus tigrinus ALCF2SS1-7]|uniref:Uncharacterized protein n=1 Tax=Lentinus tigrinus ALCF2SS1-6 TaxID=1328759 RepID=A0A5C2RV76_9APHY|nr:hypothetical protein L227DRAFT_615602 [Lentinus tigrinus ALCF2SS1-6]RPD70337.1 hypothetical protein L226DRAFT_538985 [Lentinus tigrinus ALCF2SS1-7]
MSSTHLSEDLVRTLSRLVFACIAPGTATLKLFDPTTGTLGDYLLVKVMPEASPRFGRQLPSTKTHPPPLPILNELVERLKTVVLEDVSSDIANRKPSPLLPPRIIRKIPHAQVSRTTAVALFDCSRSEESDVSSLGSLAQLKRVLFYGGTSEAPHSVSRLPTSPFSSSSGTSSSLLAANHPSDTDNSSLALDNPTGLHRSSPSSPLCLRRDRDTSSFSPVCPSAPRLLGLGFSNLLKDDGTQFDGLGNLTDDHYSCMSPASPSDEARARAAKRRGLRVPPIDAPESSLARKTAKVVRLSAASQDRDEDFGFTAAKTSTPVRATALLSRPSTPAAPPRRVIGRLPVHLEKRHAHRQFNPKAERNSMTFGCSQPSVRAVAGVSARQDGRRSSKRSPVLAGTPPGEQLRLWSNWMTPVGEKEGERRPSWKP